MVRVLGLARDAQELSGPADALQVRAEHSLDLAAGSLAVRLVITNALDVEVTGAVVKCAPYQSHQMPTVLAHACACLLSKAWRRLGVPRGLSSRNELPAGSWQPS